ncbi:cyclase family protein [Planctomycetaceae bacterium AH-315-I19]|nr:cyclase family protein [Planctomycetaceae bacterium AH-315-I19]
MIYDITPAITEQLAVFPGDTPASRRVLLDMNAGDGLTLSTLNATVHLGAHADAPSHYGRDGNTIDEMPIELYLGPCQVITPKPAPGGGHRLMPKDIAAPITEPRVLLRTDSYPNPEHFNTDFTAMSPELADHLAGAGVRLVGIDTPSVDTAGAKELVAHHALLRNNIAILEGIVLTGVPDGRYELIALPLKLAGFDASPVRAVLRELAD